MKKTIILSMALLLSPALVQANAIPEMMDKYKAAGGSNFSAEAGKKMWTQEIPFTNKKGVHVTGRACATCHSADLTTVGKHKKTGKLIAPMAPSVPFVQVEEKDIPRYSSAKKIKKWFRRNCKWTYGRECTAQEKGDFLMYFKDL